mgnify:CR=1 FL=1
MVLYYVNGDISYISSVDFNKPHWKHRANVFFKAHGELIDLLNAKPFDDRFA